MQPDQSQSATSSQPLARGRDLARATSVVSLLTTASRVLGLIRDMVVASFFGAGMVSDAFFVAFKVPNLLRRLVAEGSLTTAFVPIFSEELHHSKDRARYAVRSTTGFSLIITSILAILGMIYSAEITAVFAPGFAADPDKGALAASLMRLMFPYVIIVSLLALAASILNCLGYFALPALAPIDLNITAIVAVLLIAPFLDEPLRIYALAWSVLAGGIVGLLPQTALLRKLSFPMVPASPFRSEPVRKLCKLMLPAVLSASVYQLMIFINTSLASLLPEGSVSWLFYADRLFQFPLGVFSLAVASALLPALAGFAARRDEASLSHHLHLALGWNSFITIPSTVGLMMLSLPLIRTIFEHGTFGPEDTAPTAAALSAYCIGLWATSSQSILVRVFLAKKNSLIPALVSCGTIAINIFLALALMGGTTQPAASAFARSIIQAVDLLGVARMGHVGLALAGSLASFASLILLAALLPRLSTQLHWRSIVTDCLRSSVAAAAMGLLLFGISALGIGDFFEILLGVTLGASTYLGTSLLLKDPYAHQGLAFLRANATQFFARRRNTRG